jgi:hypothetical protein
MASIVARGPIEDAELFGVSNVTEVKFSTALVGAEVSLKNASEYRIDYSLNRCPSNPQSPLLS